MPAPGDGTSVNKCDRYGTALRYLRITAGPQRGQYVHRLVAEAKLGRALFTFEQVDHIDGNTLNNDPSNLQVIHAREHAKVGNARRVEKWSAERHAGATEETHVES